MLKELVLPVFVLLLGIALLLNVATEREQQSNLHSAMRSANRAHLSISELDKNLATTDRNIETLRVELEKIQVETRSQTIGNIRSIRDLADIIENLQDKTIFLLETIECLQEKIDVLEMQNEPPPPKRKSWSLW